MLAFVCLSVRTSTPAVKQSQCLLNLTVVEEEEKAQCRVGVRPWVVLCTFLR